jgi:hypothetical protein
VVRVYDLVRLLATIRPALAPGAVAEFFHLRVS